MMVTSDSPGNQTDGCRNQLHHRSTSSFWIGYFRAWSTPCSLQINALATRLNCFLMVFSIMSDAASVQPSTDPFASLDMRDSNAGDLLPTAAKSASVYMLCLNSAGGVESILNESLMLSAKGE
jgi:hypothetical protein